jgi:curved DNA-binding protein
MAANRRGERAVLGVEPCASPTEIRAAFRALARRHHPDLNTDPAAAVRFARIRAAYEALSADAARDRRANPGEHRWKPSGARRDNPHRAGRRTGRRPRSGTGTRRAILDRTVWVGLALEDAWRGGVYRVTLAPPVRPRCHWFRIPPGVADGEVIRLPGRGRRASDGSRGDLNLKVRLIPHPVFRVDGRDLRVDLPLAPWEAALGARVPIRTPGGRTDVRIPEGCSSGRRLRLRGRGLPNPHGDAGDLVARVRITVPTQLSDIDRELFERLAETSDFDARRSAEIDG